MSKKQLEEGIRCKQEGAGGRQEVLETLSFWSNGGESAALSCWRPCSLAAWWPSAALLAGPVWTLFVVVLEGAVNQQLAPDTGLQLRKEAEGGGK